MPREAAVAGGRTLLIRLLGLVYVVLRYGGDLDWSPRTCLFETTMTMSSEFNVCPVLVRLINTTTSVVMSALGGRVWFEGDLPSTLEGALRI